MCFSSANLISFYQLVFTGVLIKDFLILDYVVTEKKIIHLNLSSNSGSEMVHLSWHDPIELVLNALCKH